MKTLGTLRRFSGLILFIVSAVLVAGVYADTASDASSISRTTSYTNYPAPDGYNGYNGYNGYDGYYDPFNPDLQNASSELAFQTSTTTINTPSSSGSSTSQKDEVISESVLMLQKNESAIQKINFKNAGTLVATSLSGSGFELYSKQSDLYPQNVTSRSGYGSLSKVTASAPVSLDITPGSWYFTVFPLGDSSTYDIMAIQKGTSSSSSGSSTQSSSSSSMLATPNTKSYSTSSSDEYSQSSSLGLSSVAFR